MVRMGSRWLWRKSQTSTKPSVLAVRKREILVGLQQPSVSRALLGFIHMMGLVRRSSHQILHVLSPTWWHQAPYTMFHTPSTRS